MAFYRKFCLHNDVIGLLRKKKNQRIDVEIFSINIFSLNGQRGSIRIKKVVRFASVLHNFVLNNLHSTDRVLMEFYRLSLYRFTGNRFVSLRPDVSPLKLCRAIGSCFILLEFSFFAKINNPL